MGSLVILFVLFLAQQGPKIAPRDPSEEHTVTKAGDKWETPPFPLLTPGFPLGSDYVGRDTLSRLLWAIKPTLTMVAIVATVRLILGAVIGLIAGWSVRWYSALLDSMIVAALAVPVLMVALGGIAAVGIELGILSFIVGLSLTGWVETARIVRDQTRSIRGQVYIEAARALGASTSQLLTRHVLRQITPMIWMLLAYEISAVLLLTASLGFLGYYIGGDVWVMASDSVARAISGAPELGQMLATSGHSTLEPWGMIVVGGMVFTTVLGFTLLGEGLRQRLNLITVGQRSKLSEYLQRISLLADQNIAWPAGNFRRMVTQSKAFRPAIGVGMLMATIIAIWWQIVSNQPPEILQPIMITANRNLWNTARHDPYGTRWTSSVGPQEPVISWTFEDPSGFSGGPAISEQGLIYIASNGGILYALDQDGSIYWVTELPASPVGSPAISASGEFYVADDEGGLSAFSPNGEPLWRFLPEKSGPATSGPVVAPDEAIYYTMGGSVQAVTPGGERLWNTQALPSGTTTSEVLIDPSGDFLFLNDEVLNPEDGSRITLHSFIDVDQFVVGADESTYLIRGNNVILWELDGAEIIERASNTWDWRKFTIANSPKFAGVLPDHITWLFYTSFARSFGFGEDTRVVWLNEAGETLGNVHYGTRDSMVIAVDQKSTIYSCGNLENGYGPPECQAFSPGLEEPLWQLPVDGTRTVGGALASGRLYISTEGGIFYAIGEAEPPETNGEVAGAEGGAEEEPTGQETEESATLPGIGEHTGPSNSDYVLFFEDQTGFTGGPTVGDDGTVYISSATGWLYILYLADQGGGLSAFTLQGELVWRYVQDQESQTGVASPVVGMDGTIFYTVQVNNQGGIQAITSQGQNLWYSEVETSAYYRSPIISATGKYIFLLRFYILLRW
jgi:peptide/nickel transport system permease protein